MLRYHQATTTKAAYEYLIHKLIFDKSMVDAKLGSAHKQNILSFDHVMEIENPLPEINLWSVGFAPARWTKFLNEYADPDGLKAFFRGVEKATAGQEKMYTCPTKARHNHGNCLISVTYHLGTHPRLAMYSRASNLCPVGALDISFGTAIAEMISWITGKRVSLLWHISQLQLIDWDSLIFILGHPEWVEELKDDGGFQGYVMRAMKNGLAGNNPNPNYYYYARQLNRLARFNKMKQEGNYPTFIPILPPAYYPEDYKRN